MKTVLAGIIAFSLLSCGSDNQEDTVQFNVDPGLLSARYQVDSLGFSFSAPAGWSADSSKVIEHLLQQFQNEELRSYSLTIHEVFYDNASANFSSISLIRSGDSLDFNHFVGRMKMLLSGQFGEKNVNYGRFTKDGLQISQFLIMTETKVFFKLYFQSTPSCFIQLDYAIDRNIYPNYIKKIESSIGSITII